ncbi:protein kinase domain-containing protein [Nostoc commune]|uniref:protein kinase domain-containing protein n=1 Tax=Nostoc commune TaxID=1178 RepID=UPI0018C7A64B|nr:protein kinase [Nostoc commune]MBG1259902.1 hypothetical protein [Nostoc commune BAE]
MATSVKASEEGISVINQARIKKGWNKTEPALSQITGVSASTLKRFWVRESIQQKNFIEICKAFDIQDWEKIVDWKTEDSVDLVDQTIGGRYKIIQKLHSEGIYTTYLAQDEKLPSSFLCFIKELNSSSLEEQARFKRNAKLFLELARSDQIPRLLAFFNDDDSHFYLVREYFEGCTLDQEIIKGQPWNETEVLELLGELLTILEVVHQKKIILRNIRPDNLLRRESDRKLCLINIEDATQVKASSNSIKPSYYQTDSAQSLSFIAPESHYGSPQLASDIFSVGAICVEALTGKEFKTLPIKVNTSNRVWQDDLNLNTTVAAFIDRMIFYRWNERYYSGIEALKEFQKFLEKI